MAESEDSLCPVCGKAKPERLKFCSKECNWQSMRTRPTLVCKGCGVEFLRRRRSAKDAQLYCSKPCYLRGRKRYASKAERKKAGKALEKAARRQRLGLDQLRTCAACAAEFTPKNRSQIYCRASCKIPKRPNCTCKRCGKEFAPDYRDKRRQFCSERCRTAAYRPVGNDRLRAKRAGVAYERIERLAVFDRDGWHCQCCGVATPKRLKGTFGDRAPELDHRVPLALGGPHTYENVQLACRKCNQAKGGKKAFGQVPLFPRLGAPQRNGAAHH
jgi:5-methylcytosine-specific restriction endonuclease McrA